MANKTKYILLEDSHFMSVDLQQSIEDLRPDFVLAAAVDDTREALRLIENSDIDLVISDATASDGNVIETFREAGMNLPLILISEFKEYESHGRHFNMVDFILKPVSSNELENALRKYETMTEASGAKMDSNA